MTRLARRAVMGIMVGMGLLAGSPVDACPFCTAEGETLTSTLNLAQMVLSVKALAADMDKNTTEVEVETVIKDNPIRDKKKRLTLPRYIDPMPLGTKGRFLVFCDVYKDKIDPFRGMFIKEDSKVPGYCQELLKIKGKSTTERLRALFNYLDNPDLDISGDAYKEFAYADYKDLKGLYKDLPAGKILKWIKSPDTPSVRMGLFASMLGHCGKEKDADSLRKLLDDPDRRAGSGIDGALAGYVMLKPKDGWAYTAGVLQNPKEDFYFRYAVLRAVRFLYDYRPDVVSKKQIVEGHVALLGQKDIADLAIEDLRKWQRWEVADKVLAVAKTEVVEQPIVKRSLLRYALQCKGNAVATGYVATRKKEDPEAVADAQELLDLEATPKKPADGTKK